MNSRKNPPNKIRVLYTQGPKGGGSMLSLFELVRGLNRDVYIPTILCEVESPYKNMFEEIGAEFICLKNILPPKLAIRMETKWQSRPEEKAFSLLDKVKRTLLDDLPVALRVARFMRSKSFNLVHHNNSITRNRSMVIAAFLARKIQICHFRTFSKISRIGKLLFSSIHKCIFNSQATKAFAGVDIPSHKAEVIYNPIDIKKFENVSDYQYVRSELKITNQDIMISNVGRLDLWKGHEFFIRAIADIIVEVPNVRACIVGNTENKNVLRRRYIKQLYQLVQDLNLKSNVIFTGFRRDIPEIMATSDIIVHSASKPEPFGRVIAEGMAARKPVIATAAGGVTEFVKHGVTGLLVPPKDSMAIRDAIQSLIENKGYAQRLSRNGYNCAKELFNIDDHVMAVNEIYIEAIMG